jgi:RNA-directed DNA polymerase
VSAESQAWTVGNTTPEQEQLIERMVERSNMMEAYRQVRRNKGAAGIDAMTVEELKPFLQANWQTIKGKLLNGTYQPKAVRQVKIPKPAGGYRQLGIPTVVDRLIQQAAYQVLRPMFDPEFSQHSYGFRPGVSAHDAVKKAQEYQQSGKRWVVDIDLAKFFDEVNHDLLMARVKKKVKDKRMLKLIGSFLKAGIMSGGIPSQRQKGTPQGSPLSPLLSNIMLDDLDRELEKRGHSFCRYADDCNIYVSSSKAGERVMKSISGFIQKKLKLKVNSGKSAVDRACTRTFLGYSFMAQKQARLRVPKERMQRFKQKAKKLFHAGRGRNLIAFIREELNPVLRGWIQYYRLAEVKEFAEKLDQWIRRRLRLLIWIQWKRPYTRYKNLMRLGLSQETARQSAFNGLGSWFNSGASHMNAAFRKSYFDHIGLVSLLAKLQRA